MIIIEFNNVWKSFIKCGYANPLRDVIPNLTKKIILRHQTSNHNFWALKDISFKVQAGETIGIIGPNGAGKTTIFKIIAGIMKPNKGNIIVNKKIAVLIELGAGFHPDLTGRENIYLNGAIMGMKQKEIDEKFNDIVDFAEIGEFLDTSVKKYSSGMYVRLGFAVAVYTQAEILLIDEVLSVGDIAFQRKCLNKIKELQNKGITILFISHNLHSIDGICDRVIFLNEGEIEKEGKPNEVIPIYQNFMCEKNIKGIGISTDFSSKEIEIIDIQFFDDKGKKNIFFTKEKMKVQINYFAPKKIEKPVFSFSIIDSNGLTCCVERTKYHNIEIDYIEGFGNFEIEFEEIQLVNGKYIFGVAIFDSTLTLPYAYRQQDVFNILSYMPQIQAGKDIGIFHPKIKWKIKK